MIVPSYEKSRLKRLEEKGLVIETIYKSGIGGKEVYVRSTDGKKNDSIYSNIIYQKRFFKGKECIGVLENFSTEVRYTLKSYEKEDEKVSCPNCGAKGKIINFIDNCPYCGSKFNIGINNTSYGRKYQTILAPFDVIFLIISTIISLTFIISMFKIMFGDVSEFTTYMFFCSAIFATLFLFIYVIIIRINSSKNKNNDGTLFIDTKFFEGIGKKENVFFNDLYTELMLLYFNDKENIEDKDLVDFEIRDYKDLRKVDKDKVSITVTIRKIYYIDDKISTTTEEYQIIMKQNNNYEIKESKDMVINCPSCGSSIDITSKECKYCGRINNTKNEWFIESINKKI